MSMKSNTIQPFLVFLQENLMHTIFSPGGHITYYTGVFLKLGTQESDMQYGYSSKVIYILYCCSTSVLAYFTSTERHISPISRNR
jgi:hypothetical protein